MIIENAREASENWKPLIFARFVVYTNAKYRKCAVARAIWCLRRRSVKFDAWIKKEKSWMHIFNYLAIKLRYGEREREWKVGGYEERSGAYHRRAVLWWLPGRSAQTGIESLSSVKLSTKFVLTARGMISEITIILTHKVDRRAGSDSYYASVDNIGCDKLDTSLISN